MKIVSALLLILIVSFFAAAVSARTTPEDILNSKRSAYAQKVQNYSSIHKQKLEDLSQKIANLNKKITDDLNLNMEKQGQILEEYTRRNNLEKVSNDGIKRNLNEPMENARYWLTFAHEAVAYQAAKTYVFNLTSEANIRGDTNTAISLLESDINTLRSKIAKSQKIIRNLVLEK